MSDVSPGNRVNCNAELDVFPQQWPKPLPVLIAPTHRGLVRLSSVQVTLNHFINTKASKCQ